MVRVHILVEGQTELAVFKKILIPYIISQTDPNVVITISVIKTTRGGICKYSYLRNELITHLRDTERIFTTFFDYYGITAGLGFPKYDEAKNKSGKDGVKILEDGIMEDLKSKAFNIDKFIPYIQLYEFEALLFSSNVGFEALFKDNEIKKQLNTIISAYPCPEDINDSVNTAPSKRIKNILDHDNVVYQKIIDGEIIASTIGIEEMIKKCPRFKNWINSLIEMILKFLHPSANIQ